MTSSTNPGSSGQKGSTPAPTKIAKRTTTTRGAGGSSRHAGNPEDRFQRNVTIGFIVLMVLVGVAVVVAIGYGFWDANLRPIASVAGQDISRSELEDRRRLENFRLARAESQVRTALSAETIDEETANSRLNDIYVAQQGVASGAIERLVDLKLQKSLAAAQGITIAPEEVDAAIDEEGTQPEQRRVSAIIVAPKGAEVGLPSTPQGRQDAYAAALAAAAALDSGTPFEDVAREYSTDDSAEQGGALGVRARSDFADPVVADAVFGLEVGAVTGLIAQDDGSWFIGSVSEVIPAQADPEYRSLADSEVGGGVLRRNVELEALAAKLSDTITDEATSGEVDQVKLAEILVEGDPTVDPEADEGSIHAAHILYSPNDDPQAATELDAEDPAWATAEQEAQAAADALRAVTDPAALETAFAERARSESDDTSAQYNDGDLGFFDRQSGFTNLFTDPLFEDADLQPGDIVGPIKTEFGWHVIRFLERRDPLADRLAAVQAALAAPGADFHDVAREYSDGAEAVDGGETGWHIVDDLADMAAIELALVEVGGTSAPVSGADGYTIYLKEEEGKRALDAIQASRLSSTAFADWYDEQRTTADEEGRISIDPAAYALEQQ